MRQDEVLFKIAERVKSKCFASHATQTMPLKDRTTHIHYCADFAVIYLCDIDEVPEFNTMYELFDPMTIMFFYRWVSTASCLSACLPSTT